MTDDETEFEFEEEYFSPKPLSEKDMDEAYEAAYAFLKKVQDLRQEMIDDVLTPMQIDYIIDYLHDNFKLA